MNQILAIAITVSLFEFLGAAQAQDEIQLPEIKTTAVFTMEREGGYRMPLPADWVKKPYLQ